jgi:hypothetical protein
MIIIDQCNAGEGLLPPPEVVESGLDAQSVQPPSLGFATEPIEVVPFVAGRSESLLERLQGERLDAEDTHGDDQTARAATRVGRVGPRSRVERNQ